MSAKSSSCTLVTLEGRPAPREVAKYDPNGPRNHWAISASRHASAKVAKEADLVW